MPALLTSGLTASQTTDLTSQELTQPEWGALFDGIKASLTRTLDEGWLNFVAGLTGVDISDPKELNVEQLVDRVAKASDFKTPQKTLRTTFDPDEEYFSAAEMFDTLEPVSGTGLTDQAAYQREFTKLVTQWQSIVDTLKEIDDKLPVSVAVLQDAHNTLALEVEGLADKVERIGRMLGNQGSLFGGNEVPVWEAMALAVTASDEVAASLGVTEVTLAGVVKNVETKSQLVMTLKGWEET